jgi:shikimate kinase
VNNTLLIGFMGVGKGTIARAYAKEYNRFAIDTDDLIESLENKKIKNIFQDSGEKYFRDLEKRCAEFLEESVKNSIISTGGGFYRQKNLKKIGQIILLDSSFDGIYNRIIKHSNSHKKLAKRPLFNDIDSAKKLYKTRVREYKEVADTTISVENRDIRDIIKDLNQTIT